eukprot:Gb_38568 [translate_table: standard]
MAMVQPLWNAKKRLVLLILQLKDPKPIFTSTLITSTGNNNNISALPGLQPQGNGIDSSLSVLRKLCKQGRLKEALPMLQSMHLQGVWPNSSTYASLLQQCVNMKTLAEGKLVHAHIIQTGSEPHISPGTFLVTLYAKCGSLLDARRVLDEMPERNVVSWTAMMAAYVRHGFSERALGLFYDMQRTGIQPNQFTFASVLPACANMASIQQGKTIHEDIIRSGFLSDVFVGSALVDMYAKCGSIENALKVFDRMPERNVVSWNTMLVGYVQNAYVDEALKLFQKIPERNIVSWSAMIAGCAQNGQFDDALMFFRQMQVTGVKPNLVTYASVLPACANLAVLQQGKEVHEDIIRTGFLSNVFVESALVDMYAKCGSIQDARKVFDNIPVQDVFSWNAMVLGYATHGRGKEALQLFERMQHSGTKPDHVTFLGVLSACCHAGLVDDGWQYFKCMSGKYHIAPAVEHYCCMVDLLGRAGRLDEAQDFINKMPIKPDVAVWISLLRACRMHANVELGERVAENLFQLDPHNSAHYVLLSNIYAAAGRWNDRENVRKMMKERRIKGTPGCSWIEVNNEVCAFLVGNRSYPQTQRVGEIVWGEEGIRACVQHELCAA